jgi:hypothetical protein
MAGDLGFTTEDGWGASLNTTYFEDGAFYKRLTDGTSINGTVTLDATISAGTICVWIRGVSLNYAADVDVAAGDGTAVDQTWTNYIWKKLEVTSTTSVSSITFTFRNNNPGGNHDYHINGVYVTTNANEIATGSLGKAEQSTQANSTYSFADYTDPSTNNDNYVTANLLPNSSFELGFVRGWDSGRNGSTSLSDSTSTAQASSGSNSVLIADTNARYQIFTPVVRVRNDGVRRNYTFSFYARTTTGTIVATVGVKHVLPNTDESYSTTKTVTTTWTRFSYTVALSSVPTPEVYAYISHVGVGIYVDDLQLEEGSSATDYAPASQVEMALTTANVFNAFSSTPTVTAKVYNSGEATTRSIQWRLYDWRNATLSSGSETVSAGTGLTTVQLSPSGWRNGTHRLVAWMQGEEHPDEIIISVLPTIAAAADTTQKIGTHGQFNSEFSETDRKFGFTWNRSLSPGGFFRMGTIEPTDDAWSWTAADSAVNASVAAGQIIVASLMEEIPAWALSGTAVSVQLTYEQAESYLPTQAEVEEYVTAVVNRYKDRVDYWEDWNEANWVYSSSDYPAILTYIVDAVKAEDPDGYFLAFGGSAVSTWATDVWDALSSDTKAKIDGVSCHLYATYKRMATSTDTRFNTWKGLGETWSKPVWNTESGAWDLGPSKAWHVGILTNAFYPHEFWSTETMQRGVNLAAEGNLLALWRSLGHGFERYFHYDSRNIGGTTNGLLSGDTQPTIYNGDDSLKASGPALMWAQHFMAGKTWQDILSNASASTTEGYLFSESGEAMIVSWNQDKVSRLFACDKTGITQYDMHGNVITPESTGFLVMRSPTYWISNTLSASELAAVWEGATVSSHTDVTAPAVSIDNTPAGTLSALELAKPLLFWWNAIDDNEVNSDYDPDLVQTRYRIRNHNDWSVWGTQNIIYVSGLDNAAAYRLEVEAKDSEGNTGSATGPWFGAAAGNVAEVSTLNVGTLTIAP